MATENEIQGHDKTSLDTAAARKLAHTTKSQPQMQGISSRWLLKVLPWVQVQGGVFRVNRRLTYAVGDGRVSFITTGAKVQVVPQELCELPMLRGYDDVEVLQALADRFAEAFAAYLHQQSRREWGIDEARSVPGVDDVVITAKPDQLLLPLPEGASYLGFIFARGSTPGEVDRALRTAHGRLSFAVDPELPVLQSTDG